MDDNASFAVKKYYYGCSRISEYPDKSLSGYIRIINYPFNYPSTWRLIITMYFLFSFSKFLRYFTKNLYVDTSNPKH